MNSDKYSAISSIISAVITLLLWFVTDFDDTGQYRRFVGFCLLNLSLMVLGIRLEVLRRFRD